MDTFSTTLESLLKTDSRFVDQDGGLLKSEVIDKAYKADENLIDLLLSDKDASEKFFRTVKKHEVFKTNDFVSFIQDKHFLNDSYTQFKNKIGLTIGGKFLNERKEVALVWPFKDGVLEGGMTKEDEKRKEVFFNEILAADDIDRLFAPKVLTNWKRYTAKGTEPVKEIKRDADGTIRENLIIKGNNLLALHSLKTQFQGKVKLIYIDPPYNTGSDSFGYNDNFNHSTWLTFMKNRLEVARELLREDGSIWINIDDSESHYLKVLCDEIFGRENFVANIVWQKKYTVANDAKFFSDNHDHILIFARNKLKYSINGLERTEEQEDRYKNPDNDKRGLWMTQPLHAKSGNNENFSYTFKNGIVWQPPRGTFPRYAIETLKKFEAENLIWFGNSGDAVPRVKKFLSDMSAVTPATIWLHNDVGNNDNANREIKKLIIDDEFSTPKPESLIKRIFDLASNENDIILDFFAGSATSGAVAIKLKRQFILCEQMDYVEKVTIERLKKVIEGEQGGISETVHWKGGSDFVYCELMKFNEQFVENIEKAKDIKALLKIWEEMKTKSFLNYYIEWQEFDKSIDEFKKFSLDEQKKLLLQMLNKNQLYVNLSEIGDRDYQLKKEDIARNKFFYL